MRLAKFVLTALLPLSCGTPARVLTPVAAVPTAAAPESPAPGCSDRASAAAIRGDHELALAGGPGARSLAFPDVFLSRVLPNPCRPYTVTFAASAEERATAREIDVQLASRAFLVNVLTGARRELSDPSDSDWHLEASWSPDGSQLAFLKGRSGPIELLATAEADRWLASGGELRVVHAPPHVITVDGEKVEVEQGHGLIGWNGAESFDFSAGCCDPRVLYRYVIASGAITKLGFLRH